LTEKFGATLELDDINAAAEIFGRQDEHILHVERSLGVRVVVRGNSLLISGSREKVAQAKAVLVQLYEFYQAGNHITTQEVGYAIKAAQNGQANALSSIASDVILLTARGKQIKPKTLGQQKYIEAIKKKDIVIAIGPAGTGKTYLAAVMAVKALKSKDVKRVVLTRPAVEAGEKLGFLPGDLQEKVDPYLRPFYDSLYDILGSEVTQKYLDRHIIEIAPLAYMRGRTLEDSFIILDEAQNTTKEQMKMFLTRMGFGSRAVITGDITQIDLPKGQVSGLVNAVQVLKDVEGLGIHELSGEDIVRHPLVEKIIKAYDNADEAEA
jgi:phosphate starvation-inducible PhoH-like protein